MLELLGNKIAIQPRFDPDMTAGGLYIPDIAKERCDQGVVKYIGPDVVDIKVMDYVLFGGYDGLTIQIEGEGTLILIHEPFIKAIFKEVTTPLSGIYFRQKFDEDALDADIKELYSRVCMNMGFDSKGFHSEFLKIMSKHYPFFNAPYEVVMQEIMAQFSQQPTFAKITNKEDDRAKVDHINT